MFVIFDMDGTIVNNMDYHTKAWKEFYKRHGIVVSDEEIKAHFGKVNADSLKLFIGKELTGEEIKSYSEEKEVIYRDIFKKYIKPVKGLLQLLNDLKANGVKMAVATSAPVENVNFVIDSLKLRNFFDCIIDESYITNGKPDPEIFVKTAVFLNAKPDDCIVFEDSIHGIQAGKRAGMKVVAISTTYPPDKLKQADLVIKDFTGVSFSGMSLL